MDWSNQPELKAIFREELSDRARALIGGSQALGQQQLDQVLVSDQVRHAHTLKGSSRVMGHQPLGNAAEVLERFWKAVQSGAVSPSERIGQAVRKVARLLEPAGSDVAGAETDLQEAATHLLEILEWDVPEHLQPKQPEPPPPPRIPIDVEPAGPDPQTLALGGLLSSIESRIVASATRVDPSKLYRLINQAVEIRLDTEALSQAVRGLRMAVSSSPGEVAALASSWEVSVQRLYEAVLGLQEQALDLATVPLREITETFPQFVRYLARRTGKEVRFEIVGDDVQVDRQIVELLREPLRHLLVNAVDHGIESASKRISAGKPATGAVVLRANVADHRLQIMVEDDGAGIDWERVAETAGLDLEEMGQAAESYLAPRLFGSGFTTISDPTDLSGDGSGLAAVGEAVDSINGGLRIDTRPGGGTTVVLTLPSSLALQDVLLVRAGGHTWGIPEPAVVAYFSLSSAEIRPGEERMELWHLGRPLPVASLAAAIGLTEHEPVTEVVVLTTRAGGVGLTVPRIGGHRQVAVKGLGPLLAGVPHLTGAALLGGGEVVVIVEPNSLGEQVRSVPSPVERRPRVLVVDDSRGVRQLVSAALASHGFETVTASTTEEGLQLVRDGSFHALVVDYQMPGSDGVELVRTVRETMPGLPIVMVSGVAQRDDQARAWEAGVSAYLDKFDLRQGALAATLGRLLEMRGVAAPGRTDGSS